ncbi:conserved Plasmodium protein, unknown function [Plasmodium knowlesi strain H]|uniref:Uncharacterized protein n=3 Tax=Plasmodium knowlesi TaxID=5850 RepID=A0A5E7WYH8_PLAKH|nr:WD repeat-containing protein, putative [Plasmodium knowlesi strain H]OTN66560.1 Uncharacterized protein PKNOH_S08499400 [Plasmodium knowlesi]CAA9986737.1 WD repeat-containing protein, putative [Plasmodium knowlesi strain H]SBO23559.1 conserved Plasmodium protein, unknown function [Plasmodium knowlesi strain H]SBO25089.1 conserved Plasmodium protein, unknown function [Plasmodium knowlesi strain H]VVS76211.1 WD repeat-containing protein, putative [Plasmodium knowlesi strain H]
MMGIIILFSIFLIALTILLRALQGTSGNAKAIQRGNDKVKGKGKEAPKKKKKKDNGTTKCVANTHRSVDRRTPHVMFDKTVFSLKGNNYPVSVCLNGECGTIAISCNNGNLQFHKIGKDGSNKITLSKNLDEVYSCIAINEEATYLAGVNELYSTLRIFKIGKVEQSIKSISPSLEGKTELHKKDVKFLYIHKSSFIITGSELDETEVKIWDMKGDLLKIVSIKQVYNYDYAVSKMARFFAVACWSPDIKIFEIKEKENYFHSIDKVMDLKTSSGTKCVCFSDNEEKAFLIDKNGILATYNLNVRYKLQEESKILYKKDLKEYHLGDFSRMCLSGDSNHIITTSGCNVLILKQDDLQLVNKIMDAHQDEIFGVLPMPGTSRFVTWANDGTVKLWDTSKK